MHKMIIVYWKFCKLELHQSLTPYIQDLKIVTFEWKSDWVIHGKGCAVAYSWSAHVNDCKPVNYLVQTILENGSKYLKHWLYGHINSTSFNERKL